MQKNEQNVSDMWHNFERPAMQIIGITNIEKKEGATEKVFEKIFVEKFSKVVKIINLQIQEAQ